MNQIEHSKNKISLFIALQICLIVTTGCSHNIGARPFAIEIDSQPSHATAYLIPNIDWLANGMDKLDPTDPKFQDFVGHYKVTDGKTPVTTYAPSYQMMIVVRYADHWAVSRQPVVPGDVDKVNVTIDYP